MQAPHFKVINIENPGDVIVWGHCTNLGFSVNRGKAWILIIYWEGKPRLGRKGKGKGGRKGWKVNVQWCSHMKEVELR